MTLPQIKKLLKSSIKRNLVHYTIPIPISTPPHHHRIVHRRRDNYHRLDVCNKDHLHLHLHRHRHRLYQCRSRDVTAAMNRDSSIDRLKELEGLFRGRVTLQSAGRTFIRRGKAYTFQEKESMNLSNSIPRLNKRVLYLFSDRIIIW